MSSKARESSIRNFLSPLSKEDRIEALLSNYTSKQRECAFYVSDSPSVRSKCLLDPITSRFWDCKEFVFPKDFAVTMSSISYFNKDLLSNHNQE